MISVNTISINIGICGIIWCTPIIPWYWHIMYMVLLYTISHHQKGICTLLTGGTFIGLTSMIQWPLHC